jgi:hypothetical protein
MRYLSTPRRGCLASENYLLPPLLAAQTLLTRDDYVAVDQQIENQSSVESDGEENI